MMTVWAELLGAAVGGPLVVALIVGVARWALTANRLLDKVSELVEDVRELAAAAQDTVLLRAEFHAHCRQADERWGLLTHTVPIPPQQPVPRPRYDGEERRRRPRVIEAGQ